MAELDRRNLILTGLGGLGLSACSKIFGNENARSSNIINVWGMGREGEVLSDVLGPFLKENPNIQINVQQIPWSAAHEKLLTAFAGNSLPDMAQIGNSWLPEMVAIGAVSRLEELEKSLPKSDFFEGIWNTNIINENLYGIPWYVDTRVLFYRKDNFAQIGLNTIPNTWDEWHQAMRKLKSQIGGGKFAILIPLNEYEPLFTLAASIDDEILRDNASRGNFQSAGFKKTLRFYLDLFNEKLAPMADFSSISNVYDEFGRGFFNSWITGPWNIGEFKRRLPENLQDSWATTPMPGIENYGYSSAGGSSLVIFRNTSKKQACSALIEFLSRPEVQQKFFDLTGDLPARMSAWKNGLSEDKYAKAFYNQLQRVKPSPKAPEWERVGQEIRVVSELMVRGQLNLDDAAKEMDKRADKILEKRRWMLSQGRG